MMMMMRILTAIMQFTYYTTELPIYHLPFSHYHKTSYIYHMMNSFRNSILFPEINPGRNLMHDFILKNENQSKKI